MATEIKAWRAKDNTIHTSLENAETADLIIDVRKIVQDSVDACDINLDKADVAQVVDLILYTDTFAQLRRVIGNKLG